ncbi:AraC family transcriptional regulator [Desulfoscipio sp. XC116]|uniref:helix-turn-helix transcriptional regulator n=1 Tax=Desulfoscipio sp. XC116 TaxID=3144975 RepID=UPI00325B1F1E
MMMENAVQKYKVYNPKNSNCPVCTMLNSIYKANLFQKEMKIPEEAGKGYYRRIILKPSMEVFIADATFSEGMTMGGGPSNPEYCLAFCLGEAFRWRLEGNKKEYEIECGENYIFHGNKGNSICSYNPGQRFYGLTVHLDSEIIASFIHHMGKRYSRIGQSYGNGAFYKRKFSPAVKLILNDIANCPYRDHIRRIYLEGKVLELIAVYMNELILESGSHYPSAKLSSSDRESLHKARKILDENIASPPTIGKLARLVHINEYKLKTGFKKLFGVPVHAYIIDKRLGMARFLMEDKKLRVTEAALLVGYSDASHFAEKFRKKYGVNPSKCTKN